MVSYKRHIVKTISWRLIGTIDTIFLGWLVTGTLSFGIAIGGIELLTKSILYYAHERFWYKYINYGIDNNTPHQKI